LSSVAATDQRTQEKSTMTAPLPPHAITKVEQSDETGVWTKQTVRYWNEAAVKLAVREALERAAEVCDDESTIEGVAQKCAVLIRAMLKEYE
jgi:hypothetical protein